MTLHKQQTSIAERCPIRDVLDRLSDRWTVLILYELTAGTLRFSELKKRIADISPRMLAQTLRNLERDGIAARTVYPTVPPRVDYALTPLGVSFFDSIQPMIAWAAAHQEVVRAARAAYVAPAGHAAK